MKKIYYILKSIILLFFTLIISIIGLYVYAFITPKFNINTIDTISFYDKNNNSMFNIKEEDYVELKDISSNVKDAIISIEDKNFYSHNGFDILRIIKALIVNITSGKIK